MYKKLTFIFLTLIIISMAVPTAFAATLSIENETDIIQVGDVVKATVILDTEGLAINAVEAQVRYSKDELAFLKVEDGNSAINLWIEKPALKEEGTILFSGITPGGLNSHDVELVTLVFEAKKEGVGKVFLENVQALANDGLGTPAEVKTISLERNIQGQSVASPIVAEYVDTDPPEVFSPTISSDPDVYDGRKFLVFATQDKISGLDFYEVREGDFGSYERATSPYEIKDQTLSSKISIRAVDRAGNEYVAVIYPQNSVLWYQQAPVKAAILIVCIVLLLFFLRRFFAR